jgi:hypothetical protein
MNTLTKMMVLAGLCLGVASFDMAHAKPGAPVAVEFVQKGKLQAGTPVEIVVTLKPATSVDQMEVEFRGSDGLNLLSGQHLALGASAAGTSIEHRIKLSAAADGRYYVSAVIHTSVQGSALARVAAVPVVIGNVPTVMKKSATQTDASGERIKSLPAGDPAASR